MLYSLAFAISSLCASNFMEGGLSKIQCQQNVIKCVLAKTKEMDSPERKEAAVLDCWLKWRTSK